MASDLYEWLSYLTRWAHVIAGIAWIGNSFYFMWLDSHLEIPNPAREGVEGALWMVHSGGFYQVERRKIRPGEVPKTLHWFYWEATLTWLTGFTLLAILYYWRADAFLIDAAVLALTPLQAVGLSLGLLASGWLAYDFFWQTKFAREREEAATYVSLAAMVALVCGLCRVFSGRGAFIHVGAVFGTIMVLNVWVRILPAQRKMIDATQRGVLPDYTLSKKAKRRSIHNSYLTLPVLFTMLSNHYANAYGHEHNWLVLLSLIALGMAVRHFMILRNQARPLKGAFAAAAAALFAVIGTSLPPHALFETGGSAPAYTEVSAIVSNRCLRCHSAHPTDDVFKTTPKGLIFATADDLRKNAQQIRLMAVQTKAMPLGNKTGMTDEERTVLGRWLDAGAPSQ